MPRRSKTLNALDRIEPRGEYSDANTVSACVTCNKMKGCMAVDEFICNVRRIHDNNHGATSKPKPVRKDDPSRDQIVFFFEGLSRQAR